MTIQTAHYTNRVYGLKRHRVALTPDLIAARPFLPEYAYATYSRRRPSPRVRVIREVQAPLIATDVTA